MYISAKYPAYLSEIVVMDPGIGMASIEYWGGSNNHIDQIVRNLVNKMRATQSQNPRMKRWIYGKSMGTVAQDTAKSLRVKQGLLYMEELAEPLGLMETLYIIKPPTGTIFVDLYIFRLNLTEITIQFLKYFFFICSKNCL